MLPLLPDYQVSQDRNDRGDHLLWDLSDPAPCLWQAGIDLTFSSLCCYSLTLKTPPPCEVIFFCSRQEVQGVMLGGGGKMSWRCLEVYSPSIWSALNSIWKPIQSSHINTGHFHMPFHHHPDRFDWWRPE